MKVLCVAPVMLLLQQQLGCTVAAAGLERKCCTMCGGKLEVKVCVCLSFGIKWRRLLH